MSERSCTADGCDRPHVAKGLCMYHYKRRRAGKPLTDDTPPVGSPSGYGRYGIVDRDEMQVLCHECGHWYASVAGHIYGAHGLTGREYKRRHGIPSGVSLVSLSVRRAASEASRGRVGGEGWKRLEDARDPAAAAQARTPGSWASKRRPEAADLARVNGRQRTPTVYHCIQCGKAMSGRRITCSDECEAAHRDQMLREYQDSLPGRITPAERDELAQSLADPGPTIRRLQARGAFSSDIARVLGVSPAWMSEHYPRKKP